jgi:hypothetical protein
MRRKFDSGKLFSILERIGFIVAIVGFILAVAAFIVSRIDNIEQQQTSDKLIGALQTQIAQFELLIDLQGKAQTPGANLPLINPQITEVKATIDAFSTIIPKSPNRTAVQPKAIKPTETPRPNPTFSPTLAAVYPAGTIHDEGLWKYGEQRPPMPSPAGQWEVIFAHGDIDNSGKCHVREFESNEIIQGLGLGTFHLVRITGSPEFILATEKEIQQNAASEPNAKGVCPELP